jgi:hypothetical protein
MTKNIPRVIVKAFACTSLLFYSRYVQTCDALTHVCIRCIQMINASLSIVHSSCKGLYFNTFIAITFSRFRKKKSFIVCSDASSLASTDNLYRRLDKQNTLAESVKLYFYVDKVGEVV